MPSDREIILNNKNGSITVIPPCIDTMDWFSLKILEGNEVKIDLSAFIKKVETLQLENKRLRGRLEAAEQERQEMHTELVSALEGIKSEFTRLKDLSMEKGSLRDALYLDGVLAVIESKSGEVLLKATKEG